MSDNSLTGTLPGEILKLSNLLNLFLSGNRLEGTLTNQFQSMSRLKRFRISDNGFEGTLEGIMNCGNCTDTLEDFRAQRRNRLSGSIPTSIGQFTRLTVLELELNSEGYYNCSALPSELGSLTNLKQLSLLGSAICGNLPSELSKLSRLTHLQLHGTKLTGSIAPEICSNEGLVVITHIPSVDCSCFGKCRLVN